MTAPVYSRRARRILGGPLAESDTPAADRDFASRAYRDAGCWREWTAIGAVVVVLVAWFVDSLARSLP